MKEFWEILKHYNENISGKKDRPSDKNLCNFLLFLKKLTVSTDSLVDDTTCSSCRTVFNLLTFKCNLEKMILEKKQILPFFNYNSILLNHFAKIWRARGASHYPALIRNCLT